MAYSLPLTEVLYSGAKVCAICGGTCNGSPEPTGPVFGEGPERALYDETMLYEAVRPQPGPPQNVNDEPDSDPRVVPWRL